LRHFSIDADIIKIKEFSFIKSADVTFVVSAYEKQLLDAKFNHEVDVRVLANIYPNSNRSMATRSSYENRFGALFVGNMCHPPNIDAVELIDTEILSKLDQLGVPKRFQMKFVMSNTKNCANADLISRLRSRGASVNIYFDVSNDELLRIHDETKIIIAPLRSGAGVKGKINYALLHGVPVIGTYIAIEGMNLIADKHVMLADTAFQFADRIRLLHDDFETWNRLRNAGFDANDKYFSRSVATNVLRQTLIDMKVREPVLYRPKLSNNTSNAICKSAIYPELQTCRLYDMKSSSKTNKMCFRRGHEYALLNPKPFDVELKTRD
jgi:hypothetical protein